MRAGQPARDSASIGPGSALGRYRLVERIGAGGMGEVWKAHDDHLDRTVAIKMLLRGELGDETSRERFRREAMALSRLSHPVSPPSSTSMPRMDTTSWFWNTCPAARSNRAWQRARCPCPPSSTWAPLSRMLLRMPISTGSSIAI